MDRPPVEGGLMLRPRRPGIVNGNCTPAWPCSLWIIARSSTYLADC